jgi:hypothetical protein
MTRPADVSMQSTCADKSKFVSRVDEIRQVKVRTNRELEDHQTALSRKEMSLIAIQEYHHKADTLGTYGIRTVAETLNRGHHASF